MSNSFHVAQLSKVQLQSKQIILHETVGLLAMLCLQVKTSSHHARKGFSKEGAFRVSKYCIGTMGVPFSKENF